MPNHGATPRDAVADLLAQQRAVLVAPAGCGKTDLIAQTLLRLDEGRHLVLTHTHAGVGALKARLLRKGVSPHRFRVDTIASWSLRMSANYPTLSGLGTTRPTQEQWNETYVAAQRLLQTRVGKEVVSNSYASVFVDEYQDCIDIQHSLVLSLANLMPCRVVGDPLQGIFGFRGNRLVSWETDVFPNFARVLDLDHPWRWVGKNPALGAWLLGIRPAIAGGQPIDLSSSPVTWRQQSDAEQRAACFDVSRRDGSVVAIRERAEACHKLASQLGGRFTSMEEMDCKELMKQARALGRRTGGNLVRAVITTASVCMTKVGTSLRSVLNALDGDRLVSTVRQQGWRDVVDELATLETTSDLKSAARALRAMSKQSGVVVYRRELLGELQRTLAAFVQGGFPSLEEAAWTVRHQTRLSGRSAERRTVSRTLLVKGLEYEHAVLADADKLDAKNLYVALTRASTSVTVVSQAQTLTP